ncbi:uncharacterized protein LOC109841816 [Asparagus officinalis]|uniref:uncharacterized protein LOC109841816 n=1 Tax=Asparagus officinalis TaxID=4686 RepID=UPI00098E46CB|nr:uncharacterized protein LOC109841816 [Asparagus officinalis]
MNFNNRDPSNLSSSFSDNEIEDEQLIDDIKAIDAEREAVFRIRNNNNLLMAYFINQQNNQVIRGGSIPGHIVINRDRENVDPVFRMLAYGLPADATDEYIKIGESTAIESLKRFCRAVVEVFAEQYLRLLNANNIARLLHIAKQRGRSGSPTIILEAVADYDLWIWHAYFGLPGSNNDINVLEASHLFAKLAEGIAPLAHYVIQGLARFWKKEVLHDIMTACIIMHNMIIKDGRDLNATIENWKEAPVPDVEMVVDENARFERFLARHRQIKNKEAHIALRDALIDHLMDEYTNSET